MGVDKHGYKGGGNGYVGGFLHLFDWNAKSRKKLFSNKSDLPEQPKQKKRNDGNLPTTRFHMIDEEEVAANSSFKGSSEYSCASSVTDEDGYGTKAPGVVARLMGLDSLPTSNFSDTNSNPSFDSQSLRDSYKKNFEFEQNDYRAMESKPQKMIEKFQTETLPPKSAKSIPITHHKLLSPIKNSRFVSSDDPVHIMEAASKIPLMGSSSASSSSLKVRNLREKVEISARKSKISETPRRPIESNAVKNLKNQPMNKSWNGSLEPKPFKIMEDDDDFKGKKSISLALQAKVNVQKRERLNLDNNGGQIVKNQVNSQRNLFKKPSGDGSSSSSVLKQNNQKQNCFVDRGKSTTKSSVSTVNPQTKKQVSQKISSKISGNSKINNKKVPYSTPNNNNRRKRSIENSDFSDLNRDKSNRVGNSIRSNGMDVVSFTFTSPIARSMEKKNVFMADNGGQTTMVKVNESSKSLKSTSLSYSVIKSDDLSTLLEQKLRELSGCSYSSPSVSQDSLSYGIRSNRTPIFQDKRSRDRIVGEDSSFGFSSNDPMEITRKQHKYQGMEETSECGSNDYEYRKLLHGRHPSPISVLEPSFLSESCNSSDTADSHCTQGFKQNSSSVQAQDLIDTNTSKKSTMMMDIDTELSDSASSAWEPDYIKKILSDIETMFVDFTIGKTQKIVDPSLFDQLESQRHVLDESKSTRKLVFDCVSECVDSRCMVWTKGLVAVNRRVRLAEEVRKEIEGWGEMKDFVVDELVDKDMSQSQRGKWLDFDVEMFEIGVEIEGRLMNSLINELVADMLVL